MKSIGIVRRVDELGRIVIPKELRNTLELHEGNSLEIFVDGDKVVLRKYEPECVFCGEARDVVVFKNKSVCKSCLKDLRGKNEKNK